ncbi:hypothetical protein Tco_0674982 [Tanacetum coccineum]
MAKPILNKAQEQNPTKPRDENNLKIKFSKELLTGLQNNTFSGRNEEDVIGHIGKVLKILDLVKITDVDPFQLRMKAFPLSLSKGAKEWWMNEGIGIFPPGKKVGNEEGLMDYVSSDEEWEEHEYGTHPNQTYKPILDTHYKRDGSNHEK